MLFPLPRACDMPFTREGRFLTISVTRLLVLAAQSEGAHQIEPPLKLRATPPMGCRKRHLIFPAFSPLRGNRPLKRL
jgi:hypothetical protein